MTSVFDTWRVLHTAGKNEQTTPQAGGNSDAKKSDTAAADANDFAANLKLYRETGDNETALQIERLVERFWASLKNTDQPGAGVRVAQKTLWKDIQTRAYNIVAGMVAANADAVDSDHDIVATANLEDAKIYVAPVKHGVVGRFVMSLRFALYNAKRITLFSTTDVVLLERLFDGVAADAPGMRQKTVFRSRIVGDLKRLDGTLAATRRSVVLVAGESLVVFLARLRLAVTRAYSKVNDRRFTIGILYDTADATFNFLVTDPALSDTYDAANTTFATETKEAGVVLVLDMRLDYARFRGWEPARLVWSGDEPPLDLMTPHTDVATPAKKKRAPKKRAPTSTTTTSVVAEQPAAAAEVEAARSYGQFELGTHGLQDELNRLCAERIGVSDAPDNVKAEILRLSVLAYQLAFEGSTLDSLLTDISGIKSEPSGGGGDGDGDGDDEAASTSTQPEERNVFVGIVKVRLATFGLKTDSVLQPTAETVRAFDRYMEHTVVDQLSEDDNDAAPVTGRLSPQQQTLERGYHPYLLSFFLAHFIKPFGPLADKNTEIVRALLKARQLRRLAEGDRRLFTNADNESALLKTEKGRFNALSHHVEQMARSYVAKGRMFAVPKTARPGEAGAFTRDVLEAHQAGDYLTVLHLCDLFDILGVNSHVLYGGLPLDTHLYKASRGRSASFYYSFGKGLVAGPRPVNAEMMRTHVFDYVVREQHTTEHALEDDDDDGDGNADHMPQDANFGAAWRRVTLFGCALSSAEFGKKRN